MTTFLLVLHLIITLAMVGAILLQRSEGGGLVSNASSFMSARGSANFLTRLTAILATSFIVLSLILAVIAGSGKKSRSLFEEEKSGVPVEAPASPAQTTPAGTETEGVTQAPASEEVPHEAQPSSDTTTNQEPLPAAQ